MSSIATRIDSNITNFERCKRELPSAELSITLPILLIGLTISDATPTVNAAKTKFGKVLNITGKGKAENRYRIVNGYLMGTPMEEINKKSDRGIMPGLLELDEEENEEEL
jgi:hypothetical protein